MERDRCHLGCNGTKYLLHARRKEKSISARLLGFTLAYRLSGLIHILTSGLVHAFRLDESISILGVSGRCFQFYSFFHNFCKQTVSTQFRRRKLRRLNWVCTVCILPQNGYPVLKQVDTLQVNVYTFCGSNSAICTFRSSPVRINNGD